LPCTITGTGEEPHGVGVELHVAKRRQHGHEVVAEADAGDRREQLSRALVAARFRRHVPRPVLENRFQAMRRQRHLASR
jgi:hypothetical protein